jgi:hypothetical protein
VRRYTHRFSLLLSLCLSVGSLTACTPKGLHPEFDPPYVCRTTTKPTESLYLIGDAGEPSLPDAASENPDALIDPVLLVLANEIEKSVATLGTERTAVAFLGDNIYPDGLPLDGEPGREHALRLLEAQIAAVGEARGFFTLGNHDWNQDKPGGHARALAQSDYLSARAPNISVHPAGACAGPDTFNFGDHLELTFFDLWAAIHQLKNPDGDYAHCDPIAVADERRIAKRLDEVLGGSRERRAIFLTHPPMLTTGPHGGYFTWREHLFPLRMINPSLWIPLPVIGSVFPLSRMLGVTDTDMMSKRYRDYISGAKELFSPGHPTLVAAGHEHSLQVHVDPTGVFHAVSGAGSVTKIDYVRRQYSDLMSLAAPGFMRLDAHPDSSLRLHVISLGDAKQRELVYSTCIP